jgi:hypothetical protein
MDAAATPPARIAGTLGMDKIVLAMESQIG